MSRPRNPDMIRTRLLDVGLAAFARRGYHGTGIKEIVDTAQVPKGSFYNYFKSKEEFGIAIVRRHSDEFWQRWHDSMDLAHADPLQALRDCFERMLSEHQECAVNTCYVVAHVAAEVCESSEECTRLMATVLREWWDNLALALRRAQEAGLARCDIPAEQLATLFWDAWHGAMLRVRIENSVEPLRQIVRLMFDVILKH